MADLIDFNSKFVLGSPEKCHSCRHQMTGENVRWEECRRRKNAADDDFPTEVQFFSIQMNFFCCSVHIFIEKWNNFPFFSFFGRFEWERSRMNEPTKNTKAAHTKLLRLRFSPVITWYPPPMIVIKDIIFLCPHRKERECCRKTQKWFCGCSGGASVARRQISLLTNKFLNLLAPNHFENWGKMFWIFFKPLNLFKLNFVIFLKNWGNWKWSGGAIFSFLRAMTGPRVCGCCSLDIRQDMCVPECVFQTGKKWPFARVCSSPFGRASFFKISENWEEPFFHLCRQLPHILEQLKGKVSAALSVQIFFLNDVSFCT